MTFGKTDCLMAIDRRDMIFISPEDAECLGLRDGVGITPRSDTGEMSGIVQTRP